LFGEAVFDREKDMGRLEGSLARGFRRVMAFNGFGTDSFLGDELHGGAEEIMKESPLFAIEVIEERDDFGIIEALISEPLADVCPVLLFDMGVIIFVVSTATGKIDRTFSFGKMS
jgi:hypothetical protein